MLYDFKKVINQIYYGSFFGDDAQICTGKCWLERSNIRIIFTFWKNYLKLTKFANLISQSLPKPGCPYALLLLTAISNHL